MKRNQVLYHLGGPPVSCRPPKGVQTEAQVSSDRAYLAKQLAKERHTRYDDAGDLGGESQMAPYPFF